MSNTQIKGEIKLNEKYTIVGNSRIRHFFDAGTIVKVEREHSPESWTCSGPSRIGTIITQIVHSNDLADIPEPDVDRVSEKVVKYKPQVGDIVKISRYSQRYGKDRWNPMEKKGKIISTNGLTLPIVVQWGYDEKESFSEHYNIEDLVVLKRKK